MFLNRKMGRSQPNIVACYESDNNTILRSCIYNKVITYRYEEGKNAAVNAGFDIDFECDAKSCYF